MKTLTQVEITLMIDVLETAVEHAEMYADRDLIAGYRPERQPERHARNLQYIEDAKAALVIAQRLKPLEVLHKAHYHAEDDGDYMIYSDLNGVCEDCIDVLIVKD